MGPMRDANLFYQTHDRRGHRYTGELGSTIGTYEGVWRVQSDRGPGETFIGEVEPYETAMRLR